MSNKPWMVAIVGLTLVGAVPSWAGSAGGNTGGGGTPAPMTRYGACFADGTARYFSSVFTYTVGPKTGPNVFSFAFTNYLGTKYPSEGRGLDSRCDVEDVKADAEAWKKSQSPPGKKIIETSWQP